MRKKSMPAVPAPANAEPIKTLVVGVRCKDFGIRVLKTDATGSSVSEGMLTLFNAKGAPLMTFAPGAWAFVAEPSDTLLRLEG